MQMPAIAPPPPHSLYRAVTVFAGFGKLLSRGIPCKLTGAALRAQQHWRPLRERSAQHRHILLARQVARRLVQRRKPIAAPDALQLRLPALRHVAKIDHQRVHAGVGKHVGAGGFKPPP